MTPARDRVWQWPALVAYFALIAFVEWHHEAWRDEADAWLLARDADFVAFWHHMGLSGTPGLWHTLLVPFARLGFPYGSQAVLHIAIATCTAALILWKAPFPAWLRLALVFSYYFAYEYAVVVRSYALGVLLLCIGAATYERRYERPVVWGLIIALLANTNTHSLIIAAVIGLAYVADGFARKERIASGAIVMLAGGIAAAAQVYPPHDAIASGLVMKFTPDAVPLVVSEAFLPQVPFRAGAIAGVIVIALVAYAVRRSRAAILVLFAAYAGLAFLFTYKWVGGLRHAGFVILVLVFALWIARPGREANVAYAAFGVTLAISVITTVIVARLDVRYAFSGAKEMARFMIDRNLDRIPIAAHSETTTSALCPWLREPLWYAGSQRFGTFNVWDQRFERGLEVPYPTAVAAARRQFAGRPYVLLLNVEMPNPANEGFRLLYTNQQPIFEHTDERFWLYAPMR